MTTGQIGEVLVHKTTFLNIKCRVLVEEHTANMYLKGECILRYAEGR